MVGVKQTFRLFFKERTTWVAVSAAIIFQLIFGAVWMTGYEGVAERMKQVRLAVVVQEGQLASLLEKLSDRSPIEVVRYKDIETAQYDLDFRKVQMIVNVQQESTPSGSSLPPEVQLTYYMNESNPAMVKSIMTAVATEFTDAIKKVRLVSMIAQQKNGSNSSIFADPGVQSSVVTLHPAGDMHRQMIPLMLVLASFVGSMLVAMNLEQTTQALKGKTSRWHRFFVRGIINLIVTIVVSAVGATMVAWLGGPIVGGFWMLMGFLSLLMVAFLFMTQLFVLIFGLAGMLINIVLLSMQLVTSGAMLPRVLLSEGYASVSQWLPATYGVDGMLNIMFGGTGTTQDSWVLTIMGISCFILGAATAAMERDVHQTATVTVNNV